MDRDKKKSKEKPSNKQKQSGPVRDDRRVGDDISQLQLISGDHGVDWASKEAEKDLQLQFLQKSTVKQPLDPGLLEQLQISAAKPVKRLLVGPGGHWFDNVSEVSWCDELPLFTECSL